MTIPLVTMLALFGYVAYTSITNFVNLDRAPSLIRTTSEPMAYFMSTLQAERRAAFVYQSAPTPANKASYQQAISATDSPNPNQNGPNGIGYLLAAVNAPATKQAATSAEMNAIEQLVGAVQGAPLKNLRTGINGNLIDPLTAFKDYTNLILLVSQVFKAEASSLTDAPATTQGLGLISTIAAREDMAQQDTFLAGALASGTLTPTQRAGFTEAVGREVDDTVLYKSSLDATELTAYNDGFSAYRGGAAKSLAGTRAQVQQAIEGGYPLSALEAKGLSSASWQRLMDVTEQANFQGGLQTANAELDHFQAIADGARTRVYVTGAVGLLGLILTLLVTTLLARSINRRLGRLRRQALVLAHEHLPSVVSRLRRGETVDVDYEAAPLRVGNDEIGQVGRAFDAVRQTAIASAVEEARLRQGVNDVFRNLARRNQSLLQRQLTSLDQMERKANDPEVLEDLFKLDHLTTRMRRHAEGLIILSGAPPGRGWSAPVRLIDVMRGAVSEVEDYARVQVATQSRAALSGSAVTDVIHLLAELIENATSLSPPYTQVRVTGQPVPNGFVIEIEDRGLGMTPERLAELNGRLANPPDVNPANTEQLGLFVVAQLARRHGIHVTLRPSPYGGTSAVTLIPRQLVVEDAPAALTTGENPMLTARKADEGTPPPTLPSFTPSGPVDAAGYGPAHGYGPANGHGPANGARPTTEIGYPSTPYAGRGQDTGTGNRASQGNRADEGTGAGYGAAAGSPPDLDNTPISDGFGTGTRDSGPYQGSSYQPQPGGYPAGGYQGSAYQGSAYQGSAYQGSAYQGSAYQDNGDYQAESQAGGYQAGSSRAAGRQPGGYQADDVPVVTGIPVSRDAAPPFDVFAPFSRPDSPEYGKSPNQGPGYGNIDGNDSGYGDEDTNGGDDVNLPRRVRQASLAPQLRNSTIGGPGAGNGTDPTGAGAGVPQATAASLSDMRNTLSAMQRGWQQGRSQSVHEDTEGNSNGA